MLDNSGDQFPGEHRQRAAVEQLQMTHAEKLTEAGIFRKGVMHLVERSGHREVEELLIAGLPLVLESSSENGSVLYLGIRYFDVDQVLTTKLIPMGAKATEEESYVPFPVSRFTADDCSVAGLLHSEVLRVIETGAPNYSADLGLIL